MRVLGACVFAAIMLAALVPRMPPSGQGAPSADEDEGNTATRSYEEIGPAQMVRRTSFWLLFAWATFVTMSAMAIISQGTPMALEACPDLDMGTVATVVGLLSICNGAGRILFGISFDRKGRFFTMIVGGAGFIIAAGALGGALVMRSMALLVVSYCALHFTAISATSTMSLRGSCKWPAKAVLRKQGCRWVLKKGYGPGLLPSKDAVSFPARDEGPLLRRHLPSHDAEIARSLRSYRQVALWAPVARPDAARHSLLLRHAQRGSSRLDEGA